MRLKDDHKIEAIRDEALRMIVEDGFKGMSMQKLAKAANVSPATIYIYYKDRQDLLDNIYLYIFNQSNEAALINFNPDMSFAEGLKTLWLNRFRYFTANPYHSLFLEQFINSPLIASATEKENDEYSKKMQLFYSNAVKNEQVEKLQVEIYWSLAFAPLYQLIKFHLRSGKHPYNRKGVDEENLLQCLHMVLKALQPQ